MQRISNKKFPEFQIHTKTSGFGYIKSFNEGKKLHTVSVISAL